MNNYDSTLKYFVNLDNRTDRLQLTRSQVGNDFIRQVACSGSDLTLDQLDALFDMHKCFEVYRCNQTFNQASATISQYHIYKEVANNPNLSDTDFVLICEDDNKYIIDFKTKFDQLLQFLYQDQFEHAEIVILKYMIVNEQFDYCHINSHLRKKKLKPKHIPRLKKLGFTDLQISIFQKYQFRQTIRLDKSHIYSFEYKNVSPSTNPELYTNKQNICVAHQLVPFSASCYLIRKSTCKRIVDTYTRPWWFTDDFSKLVPLQNILICSPFLAHEPIEELYSSINEPTTGLNHLNNRMRTFKYYYRSFVLKWVKFIINWNYSSNAMKRKLILFISKLLGLST